MFEPPSRSSAERTSGASDSFWRGIDSGRRTGRNPRVARALALDSLHGIAAMRAAKLNSSLISRIAYDEEAGALSIWFRETGRYVYYGVPRAIYDALKKAPSAGRFFNECIKRRYQCSFDPERRRFRPTG
jgi:hypothetical protein